MNLLENLDIQTQSVTANKCVITVKVSDKLKQPYGIVHGGIKAVLAETAASLGANQWLADRQQDQIALGVNITTEHLIAVSNGKLDRKSTRLNSSHVSISYAVFCLKKKKINRQRHKITRD